MKLNLHNTVLEMTAGDPRQFPVAEIPQIAFSGRSNVGKSSLVNTLLGRKNLARVSATPGKTVTVNFYRVDGKLYLVDLPGYGFARRAPADIERWSALTDGYFTGEYSNERLRAVVQLIDLKVGVTRDDDVMLDYITRSGIPMIIVATKCDKLNKTDTAKNLAALHAHPLIGADVPIIPFSSLKGIGRDAVLTEIYKYC